MNKRMNHIAYRCPECAVATVGLVGSLGDLVRLKCECGGSALDIKRERDGKVHLSVPCIYCKDNHGYKFGGEVLTRGALTKLGCPFSGMDIAFIGDGEEISPELDRTAEELARIMASLEAEEVRDIQPQDVDENEYPPDPSIFDTINFVVRDLEAEGMVKCPCNGGRYGLRFTDDGMQVYCEDCGASYNFHCRSVSVAEEYLTLVEIVLK